MNTGPDRIADEAPEPVAPNWWRRLMKRMALSPNSRHDLLELLEGAVENNLMDADAALMIRGVFETSERQARDIMVPRAQMAVIERDWPADRILREVIEAGHSRFPVIGDSRDDIVGILLAKDLLKLATGAAAGPFDLARWLRPAVFVPESKRLDLLLKDFRKGRNHMAIIVDEYGGVAGLLTIEDVLEQIVGQIDDEYDESESAPIQKQDDRHFLVMGLTPIAEFNTYFSASFPDDEFDTVGGLVTHHFGHMPRRGESIHIDAIQFNVQRADSRRILQLQVALQQP